MKMKDQQKLTEPRGEIDECSSTQVDDVAHLCQNLKKASVGGSGWEQGLEMVRRAAGGRFTWEDQEASGGF